VIVTEEDTLGELFSEIREGKIPPIHLVKRLENVLIKLNQESDPIIFERFHHSYYALGVEWELLNPIDEILARMNFKTVLLDLPKSQLEKRSLKRSERSSEGWEQGFLALYGSPDAAINAFHESQQKRKISLQLSQLKSFVVDTSSMDWEQIISRISNFSACK
ncbi:MAG: hypothetical protein ACXVCR_18800, partial [Bdellovibrio sp.]